MDLSIQDWGAIGEIIGAVGVIATLLFLAFQIRANTKESRLTATADIAREYNTYLQHITADENLSRLWMNAVDRDFQALRGDEKARAIMVMGNFFRIMESAYIQHSSGRMDRTSWQGYERLIARSVNSSAFPVYWELRESWHNDAFQQLVNRLREKPDEVQMFPSDDA